MADFVATRRSKAEILEAWAADKPVNSAELAFVMDVHRKTVEEWIHRGLPRVGRFIRRPGFEEWWMKRSRAEARARKKFQRPAKSAPEKTVASRAPAVIIPFNRDRPLPPKAAALLARAEAV